MALKNPEKFVLKPPREGGGKIKIESSVDNDICQS